MTDDGRQRTADPRGIEAQRRGLLAKVHIAPRDLGMDKETCQALLYEMFGRTSAKDLRIFELERLVKHFEYCGWVPSPKRARDELGRVGGKKSYILTLRERIRQVAGELPFTRRQLRDLCRFACQVDDPAWCTDPEKLQRFLAILGEYKRRASSP